MMEGETFNLEKQVENWTSRLKNEPSLTDADAEELKYHLYDIIDSLLEKGLNEEEAFLIAKKRLGEHNEFTADFAEANQPIIQMRRSLLILGGVLFYFMIYYLILFTSKLILLLLLLMNTEGYEAVNWISRYIITWHFLIIFIFTSIFFLEKKTVLFLKKIQLKPKRAIFYLLLTAVFVIIDTCLFPVVKKLMGNNLPLKDVLYHIYIYFDFTFPLLMSLGFIFIYFKYYKKAKF